MSQEVRAFSITASSGTTLTSEVDLGKAYDMVFLEIPTMTSGTDVYLQGAASSGGTFRRIYNGSANTSSTPSPVFFDSTITNCFVECAGYTQFVKVELSTAMTATQATFRFICID